MNDNSEAVLAQLKEAEGNVVGFIVRFHFVTKEDLKARRQGNYPHRVRIFLQVCAHFGYVTERTGFSADSVTYTVMKK